MRATDEGPAVNPAIPAATVVLLRDADDGIEALMLRRNSKLEFAGGMWVFPGGRIDDGDFDETGSLEAAARNAAVREAAEEAGVSVAADSLVWFSHWTPPEISPKRFATYFFVAEAPEDGCSVVQVDGGEIHDYAWMQPVDAMSRRNALEIELAPPTWITLEQLCPHASVSRALAHFRSSEPEYFATKIARTTDGPVALYAGDAAYESLDPDSPGPRHRLTMSGAGWSYVRDR